MGIEILVLGANERLFHHVGDVFGGRKQAAFDGKFVDDLSFARIDPANRLGRVLRQRVIGRQIAAIHVKHAAQTQCHRDKSKAQHRKDGAEK